MRFLLLMTLTFFAFSVDAMPPKKGRFNNSTAKQLPQKKKQLPKRGGAGGGGSSAGAVILAGGGAAVAAQPQLSELGLLYKQNALEKTFEMALEKLKTADKETLLPALQEYGPARLMREMEFYKNTQHKLSRNVSDLFLKKALLCYWLRCEASPAIIPGNTVLSGLTAKERKGWRDFIFDLVENSIQRKQETGCLSVGQLKKVQTSFKKSNHIQRLENTVSHSVIENILKSDKEALKVLVEHVRNIVSELVGEQIDSSVPLFESIFLRRHTVLWEYAALTGSCVASNLMEQGGLFDSVTELKKLRFCSLDCQCNYGMCLARNRQYEKAQKWLALGVDEGHIPSQAAIGVLDAHKALDDHVIVGHAAICTKKEADFYAWRSRASSLMREKKLDAAIPLFQKCLDERYDPECIKHLVFCYLYQEKIGQAFSVLGQYENLEHPYLDECRGFKAYHEKKPRAAYTYFLKVKNLAGFELVALHAFLEVSVSSGNYETAEKIIEYLHNHPIKDISPRRAKQLHVSIMILTGRFNEARQLLLRYYAEEADEHEKLRLLGELGDAEMRYEKVRAKAEERVPDYTQAKEYLRESLKTDNERARFAYGYILYQEGILDEAIDYLSTSDRPDAKMFLGKIYHSMSDFERAAQCYRMAVRGHIYEASRDLGAVSVLLGNFKAAHTNFKSAIKHGVVGAIECYAVFLNLQKMFAEAQKYLEYTGFEDEGEVDQCVEEVGGAAAAATQISVEGTKKYQRMLARAEAAQKRALEDSSKTFQQKTEKTYADLEIFCASKDIQRQVRFHEDRIQGLLTSLANGACPGHFKRRADGHYSMRITEKERLIFDIVEGGLGAPEGVKKIVIISAEGHFDEGDDKRKADESKFVPVSWTEGDD